jgi:hypothetical protein
MKISSSQNRIETERSSYSRTRSINDLGWAIVIYLQATSIVGGISSYREN